MSRAPRRGARVAPSRECGSKRTEARHLCRPSAVAPSRECGSKLGRAPALGPGEPVAPSRECGSKRGLCRRRRVSTRRSLTGVRIETTGAAGAAGAAPGRSLTGVRIETGRSRRAAPRPGVAPSRECGSKQKCLGDALLRAGSLPHGSADRNSQQNKLHNGYASRSLTGARIETSRLRARRGLAGRSLPHGSADRNRLLAGWSGPCAGRSLTGARIETRSARRAARWCWVAPSRERGSKQSIGNDGHHGARSLPHGSADRNEIISAEAAMGMVAPSRERGSKPPRPLRRAAGGKVAPSRERGSKHGLVGQLQREEGGRSLTGARIETRCRRPGWGSTGGRSLTGARIETRRRRCSCPGSRGRSLTGARIETWRRGGPSRRPRSLPHGSADRNPSNSQCVPCRRAVAPSRERGSKRVPRVVRALAEVGRSLTGARIETTSTGSTTRCSAGSLPHGSADRNA